MENKENKNEATYESKLYRLEELRDQMSASVDNLEKIIDDQTELCSIIEKNAPERFADFLKETAQQLEALEKQRENLLEKLKNVKMIILICQKSETMDEFLALVLDTLVSF